MKKITTFKTKNTILNPAQLQNTKGGNASASGLPGASAAIRLRGA